MSKIYIGTDSGVWQLLKDNDGKQLLQEEGPPSVAFLAQTQGKLYALTGDRALWMRPDGSWQLINQHPVQEEIWAFATDPRVEGRLYLGVSPALLYLSEDGGKSWKACESVRQIPGYEKWTFPPPPHIPHIRFIAPDPLVAGAVYIGVEEGGIYRSVDAGETWESLNDGLYWDVHRVIPSPVDSRLYATTGGGFYRSDDGGKHWRHITAGLDRSYAISCVISPKQPHTLYIAVAASPPPSWKTGANAALYRSNDSGEHWVQLKNGLPSQFDVMVQSLAIDQVGSVYAASADKIFASFDNGESWQLLAKDLPTVQALVVA